MEPDVLSMSAEEFAALEDWQLQEAMQGIAGHMAVAQADMRRHSQSYHEYLSAKERFGQLRQLANILQTVARLARD